MPFSDLEGKDKASAWIASIKPYDVLDIGCGSGSYGQIVRTVANPEDLTAVEIWAPWVERFRLNEIYDKIIIADINYLDIKFRTHYDLVIIGDVIEHMTKPKAKLLLSSLILNNKNVIISFPVLHLDQGAYEGNVYEEHIDHWTAEEMENFLSYNGFTVVDNYVGDVLAYYHVRR